MAGSLWFTTAFQVPSAWNVCCRVRTLFASMRHCRHRSDGVCCVIFCQWKWKTNLTFKNVNRYYWLLFSCSTWLDLLSWWQWRCQCARAAHMAYSVPASCPVGSELWSIIDWNAHLLAVVTDIVQPLLPQSSHWTPSVCVSMQKQMWIVVTSHAGHMAEIRQSACQSIFVQLNLIYMSVIMAL